jgi:anti-sigma factor RsiW
MNCRECTEFILRYLEGELPSDEHASFERHLSHCPPCERYLTQYKLTVRAGKTACAGDDAGEAAGPGAVPEELIRAILASRRA